VNQKGTGFLVKLTIFIALIISSLPGMTYFYMTVDGVEDSVQTQGQMQFLMADCDASGSIDVVFFADLDSNGVADPDDPAVFMMNFADNEAEFPPDMDPDEGTLEILWPLHMPPGHYVIRGSDTSDELEFRYRVLPPDPLTMSISGTLNFEGITPPDPSIANYAFIIGTMDPALLMYAMTDEMGDYYVNWPGTADTVSTIFLMEMPGYDFPGEHHFYVDGHVTDCDIEFTLSSGGGLSDLQMWVEGVESTVQTQGQSYNFEMACEEWGHVNIEFYVDEDGDGFIGAADWNFFDMTWYVEDNNWVDDWYNDGNDTPGDLYISSPFHFPPGSYIFRASDDYSSEQIAFTVLAPEPLTYGVSGRVTLEGITPPDDILSELIFYIAAPDRRITYYSFVDNMGDFSCTWADGEDFVSIGIEEPYPSDDWGFSDATFDFYLDSLVTDLSLFIRYIAYEDSIHVIFEQDSGIWEIGRHEIIAYYIDPTSHALIDMVLFPDSGDIYIPVRPDPCGIVFGGACFEFEDHNFLSPFDTIWIAPDTFPDTIDLYASQTCYHFKLKLNGFDLDSFPEDGIPYDLFGTGPEGHEYYSSVKMFIQMDGDEYIVAGGRELCPGDWRAVLDDTLPGHFIPTVTETTFTIPRVETWPHLTIVIPVYPEKIDETELPDEVDIALYPNPFNSAVTVDFRVETPGETTLEIYNVMGERVMTLAREHLDKGTYRSIWDGYDDRGTEVPSGVYFFRLNTPDETKIIKGMYLK